MEDFYRFSNRMIPALAGLGIFHVARRPLHDKATRAKRKAERKAKSRGRK